MKETMYASVIDGDFDMTREDVIQMVKDNPVFTDIDAVSVVDTDGVEYTGRDLCDMAGIEPEQI